MCTLKERTWVVKPATGAACSVWRFDQSVLLLARPPGGIGVPKVGRTPDRRAGPAARSAA
jgi:hypothetical protein